MTFEKTLNLFNGNELDPDQMTDSVLVHAHPSGDYVGVSVIHPDDADTYFGGQNGVYHVPAVVRVDAFATSPEIQDWADQHPGITGASLVTLERD